MTQPAFAGSVRAPAGSDRSLDLTLSESLVAAGHISRHDSSDLTVVVFGQLSDRASLAHRLGSAEVTLPYGAELVSLLIEAYDFEWLPESSGDFALVVCNRRTGSVILARNHVGTRPLFYGTTTGAIHFSSDISPVLRSMGQDCATPYLPAVASYLVAEAPAQGTTMAEGVRTVPPGHLLSWCTNSSRLVHYWDPSRLPASPVRPREEAAAELRALIQVAVVESVPTTGLVGAHLTGGIDSAIISANLCSAWAAKGRPSPPAFAWHLESTRDSDTIDVRLINAMSTNLDMSVTWADTDSAAPWTVLSRKPLEQPTTPTLIHEAGVQAAAAGHGISTLFSGWGGDEFASYNGRHLRAGPFRAAAHRLRRIVAPRDPQLTRAGQLRGYASAEVRRQYQPSTFDTLPPPRTARATQLLLLTHGHLTERTDSWSNSAAAYGIQYVYPLLDRRIVEWVLSLPNSMVGSGRHLMRDALRNVIPDVVRLNTDKSEPSRDIAIALEAIRSQGLGLTVDPRLAPLVDLRRFADQLCGEGPVKQPGKFMAATTLLYQPGGTPLGELVTLT